MPVEDQWKETVRDIFDECLSGKNSIFEGQTELALKVVDMINKRHPEYFGVENAKTWEEHQAQKALEKEYSEPSHIQITPMKDDKWGWVVWYSFADGDSPKDAQGVEDSLNEAINKINLVVTGKYVREKQNDEI